MEVILPPEKVLERRKKVQHLCRKPNVARYREDQFPKGTLWHCVECDKWWKITGIKTLYGGSKHYTMKRIHWWNFSDQIRIYNEEKNAAKSKSLA